MTKETLIIRDSLARKVITMIYPICIVLMVELEASRHRAGGLKEGRNGQNEVCSDFSLWSVRAVFRETILWQPH